MILAHRLWSGYFCKAGSTDFTTGCATSKFICAFFNFGRATLIITSAILLNICTYASEPISDQWKSVRDKKGIKVFTRKVEGSKYEEFKGITEINSSFASVLGLLNDVAACENWIHLCEEGRVLEEKGVGQGFVRYIYQITDLPFPARNRDGVFKAKVSWGEDYRSVTITLESQPDYLPETGNIRVVNSYGSYYLESVDQKTVRLTWTQYVDPGGNLPAFIVNRLSTNVPYRSLQNFKKWVQRPEYQQLEFDYGESGRIIGIKDRQELNN